MDPVANDDELLDPPVVGTDEDPNDVVIGRVICENGSPNLTVVQFRVLPGRETTVGRIVGVRGRRMSGESIITLVRVESVWQHNPHEDALGSTVSDVIPFETKYAPEGRSTVIYRAAEADTLEEAVLGADRGVERIDSVETLPLAGSPVIEVPPDLVVRAMGLAPDPETGLDVGAVHGAPTVPIRLRREVVQTHLFFSGGIGRGKSYARGVVAEELWAQGIPQVNIDPMGEMIEATESLGGLNVIPGKGFTLPLSALQPEDVIDAIPAINKGTNIETLVSFAHASLLEERAGKRGEHFGIDELVTRIEELAPQLDMKAATFRPAMQRAKSLHGIEFIGQPFDWETQLVPGRIINIDCRGFSVANLRLIAASVARDIQRLAKSRRIPFVVLSMDEAHLIAPNDDRVVTTQVLREIARIGRHYRIGLIMTTQSPADMDRPILKRLLTRFVFAIEPDQLDALRGIFADAPDSMIARLSKLPVGTCVITGVSETIKHATVVKIRDRRTPVGGKTPDIFADLAWRGWGGRRPLPTAP
jgi:uncharacterized protein